jgi:hypothetical protein
MSVTVYREIVLDVGVADTASVWRGSPPGD